MNCQATPPKILTQVDVPIRAGLATLFTFEALTGDKGEHFAVKLGPEVEIPVVRMHSECVTGDAFSSLNCDCGHQLNEALELMSNVGGILLYLR
jgi:GTP cyclohydrolase II